MENKEKDRMLKLTQSFEQRGEIFKETRGETNAEKLSEEFKRLSSLASGVNTAAIKESQGDVGYPGTNQGRTVTSIADNVYGNSSQYQGVQGGNIAIKDNEALGLAIKRTLESGAPINNIAFYDEINWNLAQLGFPSKLPQDIKTAIFKMMS